MEYKVTLSKCTEHLGEPLNGLTVRWWKVPRMQKLLALGGPLVLIIALLILSKKHYWYALAIVAMSGIWLFPYSYQRLMESYRQELAEKIKYLVNDPELLWLNFLSHLKTIQDDEIDWRKDDKPRISDTNIKVLAFLKKNGTSQGLHRVISSFQDSGSANKHLKRLAEKGLVEVAGNDYKYIPWNFIIINDFHAEVQDDKVRKLLNESWERMIDEMGESKK